VPATDLRLVPLGLLLGDAQADQRAGNHSYPRADRRADRRGGRHRRTTRTRCKITRPWSRTGTRIRTQTWRWTWPHIRTRRRLLLLLTPPCVLTLTLTEPPTPALAGFTKTPSAPSPTYATTTLQPASNPNGSCLRGGGPTATGTVTWTASPSPFTTGYTISWTGGSTGSTTATSSPLTVPGLTKNTDYLFTITATYNNWTSTAQTTPTISC
jgi:hypothetical protein